MLLSLPIAFLMLHAQNIFLPTFRCAERNTPASSIKFPCFSFSDQSEVATMCTNWSTSGPNYEGCCCQLNFPINCGGSFIFYRPIWLCCVVLHLSLKNWKGAKSALWYIISATFCTLKNIKTPKRFSKKLWWKIRPSDVLFMAAVV